MQDRDFKGIWIPRHIWLDETLTPIEKCLIAEIHSLDNDHEKGCFASNEYLGKFLGIKEKTVANIISSLKKRGYVEQVYFDGRNRGLRVTLEGKAEFPYTGKQTSRVKESRVHSEGKAEFIQKGKQTSRKNEHIEYNITKNITKNINTPLTPQNNFSKEEEKNISSEENKENTTNNADFDLQSVKEICEHFGFSELRNTAQWKRANELIRKICEIGEIEYFKQQFLDYKAYKTLSGEHWQGFEKFCGLDPEDPMSGGWNAQNWTKKLQEEKTKKNASTSKRDNTRAIGRTSEENWNRQKL